MMNTEKVYEFALKQIDSNIVNICKEIAACCFLHDSDYRELVSALEERREINDYLNYMSTHDFTPDAEQ